MLATPRFPAATGTAAPAAMAKFAAMRRASSLSEQLGGGRKSPATSTRCPRSRGCRCLKLTAAAPSCASTLVVVVAFLCPVKLCELDPRLSHFEQEFLVRQIADLMRHTKAFGRSP